MRAKLRQTVLDRKGNAQGGVSVTVHEPGTSDPIAATMYDAVTGGNEINNPMLSDANGDVVFYLDTPQYVDLFVEDEDITRTIENAPVFVPTTGGGSDTVVVANTDEVYESNDSTLQPSDDLRFPVLAGEMWDFETTVFFTQSTNGTGTIAYTGAALNTIHWGYLGNAALVAVASGGQGVGFDSDGRNGENNGNLEGSIPAQGSTPNSGILTMVKYAGYFVAAEDGEFIFAYAKNSGADSFRVQPGTHIVAHRLGTVPLIP